MNRAWDEGINYFDTADSYGGGVSETIVGAWMKDRKLRDQLILSTKVAMRFLGGRTIRDCPAALDAGDRRSLRRLQTDHIDLYVTMEPIRKHRSRRRCKR